MLTLWQRFQKWIGRSDVWFGGSLYMKRWRWFSNDGIGVRVHNIRRSDSDRELHDHPFDFTSIILWGGYWETRDDGSRTCYGPGSVVHRRAEMLHRLELPGPAWTLVFRGPYRREWGFVRDGVWIRWQDFVEERRDSLAAESSGGAYRAPSSV